MKNKKLSIGVDASFIHGENSGTGEYAKQLVKHLIELDKVNIYTIFPFFTYIYNPNFRIYRPKLPNNLKIFWSRLPKNIVNIAWNNFHFLRSFYLPRFDIFHSTTFVIPPPFSYRKLVFTIYDVSFYTHPQFHVKENIEHCQIGTIEAVKKADIILAISDNTKRDLVKYFDCPETKIVVTPLACDKKYFNKVKDFFKKSVLNKYGINKPYIFHLGSLEPRKNTIGLIKAYQLLSKKLQNQFDLVIAGSKGWLNNNILKSINLDYTTKNNIKLIGYVSREDLPAVYQSAKCFAYPSFYEGFGIPPLEAMASGCPILVSNISSLPEICGEAALYCQPNNIEDIAEKLNYSLTHDNSELIKLGFKQAKKYSWEKTVNQTLEIYKLLGQKNYV